MTSSLTVIREWSPLSTLLQQIPVRGPFWEDLSLTCMDFVPEFIALGTNIGIVYWYDRHKQVLQKLKFESSTAHITCVKLVSSVEYMLAAGNCDGIVTIFQIPKKPTENLPDHFITKARQVERFTVGGMHKNSITALEWSMNGMKLFSGDTSGLVAKTEIDFNLHLSKSSELLNETREIVQLNYVQQQLLVSTVFRTTICNTDGKCKLTQVGSKERKSSGRYGAVMKWTYGEKQKPMIYASRPGLRLWLADQNGMVLHTLIFKDIISTPHPHIPLINPAPSKIMKPNNANGLWEPQFGPVKLFGDGLLVTYNEEVLYVIDPNNVSIVASCHELRRILDVAVGHDEMFVLEGARSLIRISPKPDERENRRPMNLMSVSLSGSLSDLRLPKTSIKELASRLKDSTAPLGKFSSKVVNLMEAWEEEVARGRVGKGERETVKVRERVIVQAVEATENYAGGNSSQEASPAEEVKPDTTNLSEEKDGHIEKLGKIGEMSFEEIIFKPKKHRRGVGKKKLSISTECASDTISVSSNRSNASDSSDIGSCEVTETSHSKGSSLSVIKSNFNGMEEMTSDSCVGSGEDCESDKSPHITCAFKLGDDSGVGEDLELKEQRLVKLLNLEEFLPNEPPTEEKAASGISSGEDEEDDVTPIFHQSEERFSSSERLQRKSGDLEDTISDSIYRPGHGSSLSPLINDVAFKYPSYKHDSSINSNLSYGPPSGSSSVPDGSSLCGADPGTEETLIIHMNDGNDCWVHCGIPGQVATMTVCDKYLCCVDVNGLVHFSNFTALGLKWLKTDYMAKQVSVSPSGSIVWKVNKNSAYGLVKPNARGPFGERWVKSAENVALVMPSENEVWMVKSDGKVFVQKGVSAEQPFGKFIPVSCPYKVIQVACRGEVVWAISDEGKLLYRRQTSGFEQLIENDDCLLELPFLINIALGPNGTGWLVDANNYIYFLADVSAENPLGLDGKLWQVLISDYIFQSQAPVPNSRFRLPETLRNLGRCSNPLVAAGSNSVLFAAYSSTAAQLNRSAVTGHHWEQFHAQGTAKSARWAQITAEGVYQSQGSLWILGPTGELFACEPRSRKLQQVVLDCRDSLMCIAAAPEALWVLSSRGTIFIREGISTANSMGIEWQMLDLSQLESVQLVHVSCGSEVVWACDNRGTIYMRIGSLQPPSITDFPPAWVTVDGRTAAPKAFFTKVYVGTRGRMVWALDDCRNIYVREAIFSELPIGTSWVLVSGIEAIHLTVSETAVWALSPKGEIYRRYGITETNYIGDYWRKIPGTASVLSASLSDELWAVDSDGRLVHHLEKIVTIGDYVPPSGIKTILTEEEDEEWEILGVENSTDKK